MNLIISNTLFKTPLVFKKNYWKSSYCQKVFDFRLTVISYRRNTPVNSYTTKKIAARKCLNFGFFRIKDFLQENRPQSKKVLDFFLLHQKGEKRFIFWKRGNKTTGDRKNNIKSDRESTMRLLNHFYAAFLLLNRWWNINNLFPPKTATSAVQLAKKIRDSVHKKARREPRCNPRACL